MATKSKRLIIGMETFQRPFQKYLDQYVRHEISEEEFLQKTEYFRRWGFEYNLYRDILQFARAKQIPVIALNIRKEIVEKIAWEFSSWEKGMASPAWPRVMDYRFVFDGEEFYYGL